MSGVGSTKAAGAAGAKTEKTEGGEEKEVSPMKEEAYAFIGCLYRLRKRYKLQGFNPDFTKKMFGPYILNKLSRWDGDIQAAVDLWCSDPAAAEEKYGHISKWDVSHVTNLKGLLRGRQRFNEDVSAWDVSKVTTMGGMFNGASAFHDNTEAFARPLWTSAKKRDLVRWKVLYKEAKRFNALVIGEHVRADRKKTDGSAAGVAVGVVARVLTTPGLAGEMAAFLLCSMKD